MEILQMLHHQKEQEERQKLMKIFASVEAEESQT